MYTIRQASARIGVSVPTIRAWERRYGIVQPARTPGGYRLYDQAALERLGAMRRLVADGWQPSVAAAAILDQDPAAVGAARSDGENPAARLHRSALGEEAIAAGGTVASRLVAAAQSMDEVALSRTLDDVFSGASFERAASDRLFPALQDLGEAWASGSVSVAGEHLVSHAILRRLAQALDAAGRGDSSARPVVVGLPPGSRHELGALAFAVALRRAGTPVAYLGPDLPVDDWVRAVRESAAAVIGVVTRRDRRTAELVARSLVEAVPGRVVAVGGGSADGVAAPGTIQLPARLEEAVATLQRALGEPARRRVAVRAGDGTGS